MTATLCPCGKPPRDNAYLCDDCAGAMYADLEDVTWLVDELEVSLSGLKAASYSPIPTKGLAKAAEPDWNAGDVLRQLTSVLRSWVHYCHEAKTRHQSPHERMPGDNLLERAEWLRWRVDGLALDPRGPEAAEDIGYAVSRAKRIIFHKPRDRQYLGDCPVCAALGPGGDLFAYRGANVANCIRCGAVVPAEALRAKLLAQLDDRLHTAAEIAQLSTYLGLVDDREKVRKRINTWASRGIIIAAPGNEARFRFGTVCRLLIAEDSRKAGTS